MSPPWLQADRLDVRLGGRPVLRGVTARFERGWTALVGPNGAGKSTLLRTCAGLQAPAGGRVQASCDDAGLLDRPLHDWPAAARARQLGWLAQGAEVGGDLNVRETIALGRIARHGVLVPEGPDDAVAIERAMTLADCQGWDERALSALSGGERQRVLLARVLATEAPVLLLDEPTTHLDAPHQVALARLFRRLAATQVLVTVLHDLPIALRADRLLVMHEGRVQADGPPQAPAVQDALGTVFGGALRFGRDAAGRPQVVLALDD